MDQGCTRRQFLKGTGLATGGALLGVELLMQSRGAVVGVARSAPEGGNPLLSVESTLYTTCLQCHIDCNIKVRVADGVAVKIDGNPLSPQNLIPNLPSETTSLEEAARVDGKVCPRGQAGLQTLYDPYRLVKVLKRTGPRGSNQWRTIPFSQAVEEIVEGGRLFADIGEDRHVPGLRELFVLKDGSTAEAMAADIKKLQAGAMTVDEFKGTHGAYADVLLDPEHPDLGPKNNGFVFMAGRIEHGRGELAKRFVNGAFGSVNFFEHTTICEQSHHIAYAHTTDQPTVKNGALKFEKGKTHMKPDLLNAEFVIFFGTGAFEANFGVTPMAEKVTHSMRARNFRFAVVDPRLSKTAGKADHWVPIKPGTDAALAMAMVRWIIDNQAYDEGFLRNATKAAAAAFGESCWSGAGYLVEIQDGVPGGYLRADAVGLGSAEQVVVVRDGVPVPVSPGDETAVVVADLDAAVRLNGVEAKTAFRLLSESARSKTVEEYAEIAGVDATVVETLAREFTSHGKKAVAEMYRGAVQHTNGYYNGLAILALNCLVGNPDWTGGLSQGGGHWHEQGDKEAQPYPLADLHPGALAAFGVPLTREKWAYEKSTLFARDAGYPATRPWYPFTSNVYQEVLPSAGDGYPYPIQVLFNHKGAPLYSTPAGHLQVGIIRDLEKIPLVISCDIVVGETTVYADYIFPDITYLERWGFPHPVPDVQSPVSPVRQPVVGPLTEVVEVAGEPMPVSLEAVFLAVADRLGLSGFGRDAFGPRMHFTRPEDYYLKLAANIAAGDHPDEAVPDASDSEMQLFQKAREHLPAAVYSWERWRQALRPEEWAKVVYVLNRGGRFDPFDHAYDGERLAHALKGLVHLYMEGPGKGRHSLTGKPLGGTATYLPPTTAMGQPLEAMEGEYKLITYKEVFHTQSRTIGNYWVLPLRLENTIWMSAADAAAAGLQDGDEVRLTSRTNPKGEIDLGGGTIIPITGRIEVRQGVRPGVVAVSHHFGHWGYGSATVTIDGQEVPADPRRGRGLTVNPLMLSDPDVPNVCLTDPVGGSASFMDSWVRVERVA